jgi:Ca2+-binding RTX toxin-like protein
VQIENLIGSAFDDVLTGDNAANELFGAAGNDLMNGNGGADRLSAGVGNDRLFGAGGNDFLRGDAGDDVLDGGSGFNELRGESGIDTADYSTAAGSLDLDLRSGAVTGDRVDSLSGIENAIGSAGAGRMIGTGGANRLDGGAGDDSIRGLSGAAVLRGGTGNDTIDGGMDDDLLIGGAGADLFVFKASDFDGLGQDPFDSGADRITDFNRGEGDRIDLRGHFEATTFADLRAGASQFGTDTVLTIGDDTIRLDDVALAELSASMFLF